MFFIIRQDDNLRVIEASSHHEIVESPIELLHMNGYLEFQDAERDLNYFLRETAAKIKIDMYEQ